MEYDEYIHLFNEHRKPSPTGEEYIDSIDETVDSVIAPLIRTIDEDSRFETESSCSGALCDHYNLNSLRESGVKVCDDSEFVLAFESVVPSEISIAIIDEWHHIQSEQRDPPLDSDVYVDGEFYDFQDAMESILVEYESDATYGWPINVEYSRQMIPQWVHITVSLPVRYWIQEVSSFEEYDAKVESLISMLIDVFSDFNGMKKGDWPSLRYDVVGSCWYEEEREF